MMACCCSALTVELAPLETVTISKNGRNFSISVDEQHQVYIRYKDEIGAQWSNTALLSDVIWNVNPIAQLADLFRLDESMGDWDVGRFSVDMRSIFIPTPPIGLHIRIRTS